MEARAVATIRAEVAAPGMRVMTKVAAPGMMAAMKAVVPDMRVKKVVHPTQAVIWAGLPMAGIWVVVAPMVITPMKAVVAAMMGGAEVPVMAAGLLWKGLTRTATSSQPGMVFGMGVEEMIDFCR